MAASDSETVFRREGDTNLSSSSVSVAVGDCAGKVRARTASRFGVGTPGEEVGAAGEAATFCVRARCCDRFGGDGLFDGGDDAFVNGGEV